jgi:hypothetical protein
MRKITRQKPLNSQITPKLTDKFFSKMSVKYNDHKYKLGGKSVLNKTSAKDFEKH